MPNIKILYDFIIKNSRITTNDLNDLGFLEYIADLERKNIISLNVDESCTFKDIEGLYKYGLNLKDKKLYTEAISCFEKCLVFDPMHNRSKYLIFACAIETNNDDLAISYLRKLINEDTKKDAINTYNFYLYLLSLTANLPNDLKTYLSKLKTKDFLLANPTRKKGEMQNEIRLAVLNKKYTYAKATFNKLSHDYNKNKDTSITRSLFTRLEKILTPNNREVIRLVNNGNYDDALALVRKYTGNNAYYKYLAKALEVLILLDRTEEVPTANLEQVNNFFIAIDNHNYDLAILLCERHMASKNMDGTKNSLYIVLSKIKKKINDLKEKEQTLASCDNKYILDNIKKIERDGLVILEYLSDSTMKSIIDFCNNSSFLRAFLIDNNEKLVIKEYRPGRINFNELVTKGNNAYYNGDNETSIQCFRKLLQINCPAGFIYAMLGKNYMKLGKAHLAASYYMVAGDIAKKDGKNYDFTELINKLLNKPSENQEDEDTKVYVEVSEDEFKENYGIENLRIVIYLMESGIDINTACSYAKLSFDQTLLVYLVFAREYYSIGDLDMGDAYLKVVARTSGKSDYVKELLHEIKRNRKLYLRRKNSLEDSLVGGLKRVKPISKEDNNEL